MLVGAQQYSRVLRRTRAPNELARRPGQVQLDAVAVRVLGRLQRSSRRGQSAALRPNTPRGMCSGGEDTNGVPVSTAGVPKGASESTHERPFALRCTQGKGRGTPSPRVRPHCARAFLAAHYHGSLRRAPDGWARASLAEGRRTAGCARAGPCNICIYKNIHTCIYIYKHM